MPTTLAPSFFPIRPLAPAAAVSNRSFLVPAARTSTSSKTSRAADVKEAGESAEWPPVFSVVLDERPKLGERCRW